MFKDIKIYAKDIMHKKLITLLYAMEKVCHSMQYINQNILSLQYKKEVSNEQLKLLLQKFTRAQYKIKSQRFQIFMLKATEPSKNYIIKWVKI